MQILKLREHSELASEAAAWFHSKWDIPVEESYRCLGIAGKLLDNVCEDMRSFGLETLYLITDHTGFYERYGWRFLCMVQSDDNEADLMRMYVCDLRTKQL